MNNTYINNNELFPQLHQQMRNWKDKHLQIRSISEKNWGKYGQWQNLTVASYWINQEGNIICSIRTGTKNNWIKMKIQSTEMFVKRKMKLFPNSIKIIQTNYKKRHKHWQKWYNGIYVKSVDLMS